MIFTNNYVDKEMSNAFLSQGNNKWRLALYSFLCSIVAFVISMLLFSLSSTIIYDIMPSLSGANAHSLYAVLTYLLPVVLCYVVFYLFSHYSSLTFAEVNTNRMYMLIKMNQKMGRVILLRIYSAFIMPLAVYLVSFIFAVLISLIFGYTINVTIIPGMFLSGVSIIFFTVAAILTISVFILNVKYAVTSFIIFVIIAFTGAILSGYTRVIQASINMQKIYIVFGASTHFFLPICLVISLILLAIVLIKSFYLIKFYNINSKTEPGIVVMDYAKEKVIKLKKDNSILKEKIFNGSVYGIFGFFIILAFATNMFLIYMGTNNLENQTMYNRLIPVLFGSETMMKGDRDTVDGLSRPQFIEKNDLAVFEAVDSSTNIEVGNIIYYIDSDKGDAIVEKVLFIEGDNYTVDLTYYPNEDDQGSLATTINRSKIKGVCVYVNRGVGAWIVLNESTMGKIVFLIFPLIVIIFYDRLRKILKAYRNVNESEYYNITIKK